ncbi:MAG TPA: hypothetical protein VHG92_01905 [Afifellaceae bacterium]|nr:hypothetical protein [Afifellaceae bacterium]
MSIRAFFTSLRTLSLLALSWTALGWLGGEILDDFGEAPAHASRSALVATLLQAAEAPPESADGQAEIAAAEAAAQQALRDSPLDASALAMLGLAATARAEPERAKRLMELAAIRVPAHPLAQGWLFHHRLAAADATGALAHADAMLRAQPGFLETLLPALAAIAADPESQLPMAELLTAGPPWRSRFLERLAAESADPLAPFGLYAALMAGSDPPSRTELRPYLARLVDTGLYEQARLLWTQAVPAERLAEVGYLANGGFEEPPTGFLFDWSVEPVAGARAEFATIPDGDGSRGLRIQFHDRQVTFRHVRQLLMLMPGRYRLSGRAKAEGLRNARGLHWTLTCADERDTRLGATERISGTTRWHGFEAVFEVPASGCRAQWLRLELAARIAAERHSAGAAWYDDMAVSRIDEAEDSCPDEGPPVLAKAAESGGPGIDAAAATTDQSDDEDGAQCTCAAPTGTTAELIDVTGDVVVFRGEQTIAAERQVSLAPGDRVMVRRGGQAVLRQGLCRFDLASQSVVTLREDECTLCAAVVTAGEAEVAYGQSAGGAGIGGGATGGGVIGSPTLAPLASQPLSPLSGIVIGLPSVDDRPPTSR